MTPRRHFFATVLACAALIAASADGHAADRTWDGGGASGLWNLASNWVGDTAPAANDVLFFDGSTRLLATNNFAAGTQFNGINFATGAGAFTNTGNSINLGGNITNASSTVQVLSLGGYALQTAVTIDAGTAGLTFTNLGKISGAQNLTKTGSGDLTLYGNQDGLSGRFLIDQGRVVMAGNQSTPLGTGALEMKNGTSFIHSGSVNATTASGGFYVANGAIVTLGVTGAGSTNTPGALALQSGDGYGQGVTIVKTGAGVLRLNSASTSTNWGSTNANTWQVDEGTLLVQTIDANSLGSTNNGVVLNGGALEFNSGVGISAGRTVTLNGASIGIKAAATNSTINGTLTGGGGFAKIGAGTVSLAGANTHAGTTTISEGRLVLSNSLALQNSVLDTSGAGTVGLGGAAATNVTLGGLSGATDLATEIAAGYSTVTSITLNTGSGTSSTYSGVIANGAAGMSVVKSGTGTQTLSGDSTYTGTTSVQAGKLVVDGSIALSAVTVTNGGTIGGSGSVGALTIADGGTLAPGNSPGTLFAESSTWSNGGSYDWEILSLLDDPGTSWDLLSITNSGTLNLSGLTAGGYTINLITLSDPTTQGALAGFTPTATYTNWLIASASGIDGFEAGDFSFDSAMFVGATGTFGIEQRAILGGQGLFLTYTGGGAPIPEPGTWAAAALLAVTSGLIGWRRRRIQAAWKSTIVSVSK